MNVFFYGLFMDKLLLAKKRIFPNKTSVGYVDGFALRIGARATLLPTADACAYGVMMDITENDANSLYAEPSVADYAPESVSVHLADGGKADAVCYNLPAEKVAGTNKDYAKSLLDLAISLGFPESYLDEIRRIT